MKKLILALICACLFYATGALAAVNINTAGAEQLQTLDGIGKTKAVDILKDRKANGPYKSVDDLSRVKGIGQKTVDKLRSEATVKDDASSDNK